MNRRSFLKLAVVTACASNIAYGNINAIAHTRIAEKAIPSTYVEKDGWIVSQTDKASLLEIERDALRVERDALRVERDALRVERDSILKSNSWKITKPLRDFKGTLFP